MDKIGEVIGPKGKVINTITQETGADVSVSDDGAVGLVTIGSTNGEFVEEARRRIELILDPPTADVGAEYTGRVVNVTKFGAFVNILPGRDGLLHISKLGRGKRVERVEDVLNLGDEVTVRVDDIDNQGKLSLSFADDTSGSDNGDTDRAPREAREPREPREPRSEQRPGDRGGPPNGERSAPSADADVASFDEFWDSQAKDEFGDLGPGESRPPRRCAQWRTPERRRWRPRRPAPPPPLDAALVLNLGARFGVDDPHSVRRTHPPSNARASSPDCGSSPSDSRPCARSRSDSGSPPARATRPTTMAGASHFLEHLLFKGTETRHALEIAEADRIDRWRHERGDGPGAHPVLRPRARSLPAARVGDPVRHRVVTGAAHRRRRVGASGDPRGDPDA